MYTVWPANAIPSSASETRLINLRFRSFVDSEPFDDLAPVRCVSCSGSDGEKSRVGTDAVGIGSGDSSAGSGAGGGGTGCAGEVSGVGVTGGGECLIFFLAEGGPLGTFWDA
jgi:hypothetical protein